mgnify:FL=1
MGVNADSPWKEAKLFVNDREIASGEPIPLFRGQENVVRVEVPPDIKGALSLGLVNDEKLTIVSNPPFNEWVEGDNRSHTWRVKPNAGQSGLVQFVVLNRGVDEFWSLLCWVLSIRLADEVEEVLVQDYVPPLPSSPYEFFFKDELRNVIVIYKQGSPLRGYPLKLIPTPLTGVQPDHLVVNPAGPVSAHKWTVNAHTNSGTFRLVLQGVGMSSGITLPTFKVISRDLREEADFLISGKIVPPGGYDFPTKSLLIVSLQTKPDSPLAGLPFKLKHKLLDLRPEDLTSVPGFDNFLTEYRWLVRGISGSGRFQLSLEAQGLSQTLDAPVCRLISELDIWYNGILKDERHPIVLIKNQWADLTFKLKRDASSPNPIELEWVGTPHPRVTIDPALPSSKPIDTDIGAIWRVHCPSNSEGVFSLRVSIEGLFSKEIRFIVSEL